MRWLLWLVLLATGCASTRTEEVLQRVERELALLRAEQARCATELQTVRREQQALATVSERRLEELVTKAVNALVRSAMQGLKLLEGALPGESGSGEAKKVEVNKYRLKRAELDGFLRDSMALARSVRIVPSVRNGAPAGFVLYAIRPGSFWSALGLQNGDAVEKSNGMPFTTAEQVLKAFTNVKSAKKFSLVVRRRSQLLELQYHIEP